MKSAQFLPIVAALALIAGGCSPLLRKPVSSLGDSRPSRAVEVNGENAHAYFQLGRIGLDEGRPEDAIKAFHKARSLKPDFEEAWNGEGIGLLDEKRYTKAAAHYAAMGTALPKSPFAPEGSAAAALGLRKLDEAKQFANAALAIDSKSSQACRILGEVAYIQGDYPTAITNWKRAIELNPGLASSIRPTLDDLQGYVKKYGNAAP